MRIRISVLLLCLVFILSCNQNTEHNNQQQTDQIQKDSSESCAPIKDPNNPKPMALMMRQMAANADSMRTQLLRNETLDSLRYPFMRFYMVEPTDPKVLQPQFYENARLFQVAYKEMFRTNGKQIVAYNAMIGKCINCHESYCSGPLKRIRKFPIVLN